MIDKKCYMLSYLKSNDTSMFDDCTLPQSRQIDIWSERNFGCCVIRAESVGAAANIFTAWATIGSSAAKGSMCSICEVTDGQYLIGCDTCDLFCITFFGIGTASEAGICLIRANNKEEAAKQWEKYKNPNTQILIITKVDFVLPFYKRKVALFDDFAFSCQYFTSAYDVNNGYGCTHPKQEQTDEDKDGIERGKCYCWSCPLGVEAEEEDLDDPDIDWNCFCTEREVCESEYIMINVGAGASPDEKSSLWEYERRMHRYNFGWSGHKEENRFASQAYECTSAVKNKLSVQKN